MAVEDTSPIRFQGPPAELVAAVDLPPARRLFIHVGGGRMPLRARGDTRRITTLSFSMPENTAPGETEAEVVLGETVYNAVVDVHLCSRVRVLSNGLALRRHRDGTLQSSVDVRNSGNAEVALEAEQTVVLRPAGALSRSVRRAFKDSDKDVSARLIELGRHLAAEHSVELAVTISSETPQLAPGAQTRVSVAAAVPGKLEPGTTWTGRLAIYDTRVPITLEQEG